MTTANKYIKGNKYGKISPTNKINTNINMLNTTNARTVTKLRQSVGEDFSTTTTWLCEGLL